MKQFLFRAFRNNETKVHELNYLFWECTTRCNLHCRHCGSDCKSAPVQQDMPRDVFMQAMDTIPRNHRPKDFTVVLTGGEPLLRPDITDVIKEIRSRGFGVGMVSNGFFYDEKTHSELRRAGLGALTISLDGLTDTHNWMRGHQSSYDKACKAISIASADRGLAFDVVTCVHKRNLPELPAIRDRLEELGAGHWRLFTIIPIGRAAADPDMRLSPQELRQMMDFIAGCRKNSGALKVSFSCEGWLGPYENVVRDTPFFCRAGVNIASVLIDGTICACPNIDREAFGQGNVCKDNFYEVWQTRFQPFRDRSWAKRGRCATCSQFRNCLGGGMHNWHGACSSPLDCHFESLTTSL